MKWWIIGGIAGLLIGSLALRFLAGWIDAMLNRRKATKALRDKPAPALLEEIDAEIADLQAKAERHSSSMGAKSYIYRRLKWWRRYREAVVGVAESGR